MASFWISECVPIPVTALFPYFLFPLFGLASVMLKDFNVFLIILNCLTQVEKFIKIKGLNEFSI